MKWGRARERGVTYDVAPAWCEVGQGTGEGGGVTYDVAPTWCEGGAVRGGGEGEGFHVHV